MRCSRPTFEEARDIAADFTAMQGRVHVVLDHDDFFEVRLHENVPPKYLNRICFIGGTS
jgi:hypothetical protein